MLFPTEEFSGSGTNLLGEVFYTVGAEPRFHCWCIPYTAASATGLGRGLAGFAHPQLKPRAL